MKILKTLYYLIGVILGVISLVLIGWMIIDKNSYIDWLWRTIKFDI